MHPVIEAPRQQVLAIAAHHGVTDVGVFASMARDEADETGDADLLVRPLPGTSLLELGGLLADGEDLSGRRVDVVSERAPPPAIRERASNEAQPL